MTMSTDHQPQWKRSSYCNANGCVEVAQVSDRFLVRDAKNPEVGHLSFTREEWTAFVRGVEAGEFSVR